MWACTLCILYLFLEYSPPLFDGMQVLLRTSFSQTLLIVQSVNGSSGANDVVEAISDVFSYTATQLLPATSYRVIVSILFVGGGQGTVVATEQLTLDGRECFHHVMYILTCKCTSSVYYTLCTVSIGEVYLWTMPALACIQSLHGIRSSVT